MKSSRYDKLENHFYIEKDVLQESEYKGKSHYHNLCEIFYFLKGEARYFVRNQCYTVKAGDIVFVDTYEVHKAIYTNTGCERVIILYHPSITQANPLFKVPDIFVLLSKRFSGRSIVTPPQHMQQQLQDTVLKLLDYSKAGSLYRNTYLNAYFIVFITQIADCLSSIDIASDISASNTDISNIITYLNRNIGSKLSLDVISCHFNMSKYHMCRLFKQHTGLTIIDYVNRKRVITAEKLIGLNKYTFTDIAGIVGFNNLTHFERIFKSITGTTPRSYRKRLK